MAKCIVVYNFNIIVTSTLTIWGLQSQKVPTTSVPEREREREIKREREKICQLLLFSSTLEERADRLFQTKGVPLESLDSSLFAKSKSVQSRDPKKQKEIALLEAQIYRYTELLGVCYFFFY